MAKNYAEATPVLERAAQLQPGFAKAHLNLGDAYRGVKQYERAQEEYQKALQLFPNYADAVFNLGILYLDADKMPNMDLFAKQNTAIQYLQKYKQMMGGTLPAVRPGGAVHPRGAGQDQERGEAPGPPEEAAGARDGTRREEGRRRRQEGGRGRPPAPGAAPAAPAPAPPAAPAPAPATPAPPAAPAGPPMRSHQ